MDDTTAHDINHNFKLHSKLFESQIKIDEILAKKVTEAEENIKRLEGTMNVMRTFIYTEKQFGPMYKYCTECEMQREFRIINNKYFKCGHCRSNLH